MTELVYALSNVHDMTGMFCGLRLFNGDLSGWDVGQVKSMAFMFSGTHSFTGDISRWDVSHVKNMMAMFNGASEFDGNLSCWDVSNVENMSDMFHLATSFSGRGDLSDWEVEDIDDATRMFFGATSFTPSASWGMVAPLHGHSGAYVRRQMPWVNRPSPYSSPQAQEADGGRGRVLTISASTLVYGAAPTRGEKQQHPQSTIRCS